jgi:riboflavin kinase/FMN adenylyltransferase
MVMEEQWLSGRVVQGLQNGRTFGFPTINIELDKPDMLNETGVFATEVILHGMIYHGMLYVGTRPTLDLDVKTVEINIFDFDEDCYGLEVKFKIKQKIRPEKKFHSLEDLISQLRKDKDEILQLFDN